MISIYLTELQWSRLAGKMTLAQISDVIFLFLLPIMLKRLGYKKTIFIGIFAWSARYFLLAGSVNVLALQTAFIFGAILLHGVCYDFLFIAGQLYVDEEANERMRGACQGFIAFILWGIGAFVGTMLAGKVLAMHTLSGVGPVHHNWREIWLTPALGATVVLVLFAIFFREPPKQTTASVLVGRQETPANF
jgi:MFS family permease